MDTHTLPLNVSLTHSLTLTPTLALPASLSLSLTHSHTCTSTICRILGSRGSGQTILTVS